ncbi:MAG: hypothetical protein A2252_00170 [Elusimicrobia bacterium RIFOXYA2_FULL_39_19]|nr:MAG: hypothetical protein A2252_00170 [Elusimicrobia bacterium RIFOXYA2_FULL_39_19]
MKINILKTLLFSVLIIFIMGFTALYLLNKSGLIHEKVKTFAVKQLQAAGMPVVLIENIQGNLLTHIDVINLHIDNKKGFVFSADKIRLYYFLPSLFFGKLTVYSVVIETPLLIVDPHGRSPWQKHLSRAVFKKNNLKTIAGVNVTHTFTSATGGDECCRLKTGITQPAEEPVKKTGADMSFLLNKIEIINGGVKFKKDKKEQNSFYDINLSARVEFSIFKKTAAVRLYKCSAGIANPALKLTSAKGKAEYETGALMFSGLLLESGDSKMKIDGTVAGNFKTMNLNINVAKASDVSGTVLINGPLNNLEIIPDINFKTAKLDGAIFVDSFMQSAAYRLRVAGIDPDMITDVLHWPKQPSLAGRADLLCTGTIKAKTLNELKLNAVVTVKGNPSFNKQTVNEAKMFVKYEKQVLNISSGTLDSSAGKAFYNLTADAKIQAVKAELSFNSIEIYGYKFNGLSASLSGNKQLISFQVDLAKNQAAKYRICGNVSKENKVYFASINKLETVDQPSGWKSDGEMLIKLSKSLITFDKFLLIKDKQKLWIKGSVGFKDNMKIIVKAKDLELADLSEFTLPSIRLEGKIDAEISAQGSLAKPFMTGNITILKSNFYFPSSVKSQTHTIEVIEKNVKQKKKSTVLKPKPGIIDSLGMSVAVNIPGNSWVHWDEGALNTEVKGAINIKKNRNAPFGFTGEINTIRGAFKYLGKTLQIDEGNLVFTGGSLGDAQLDVKSSKQFPDIIVSISVSGALKSPRLIFSSIPEADQGDIISYLMFGKPSNKLNETEENSLSSIPLNVLGSMASEGLRDMLGNQLAPEVIEINPVSGGTIGVGKYITNKLFIKYEWKPNYEDSSQAIIDYQLSPSFSLQSQSGNSKTSGMDIFWNYSY